MSLRVPRSLTFVLAHLSLLLVLRLEEISSPKRELETDFPLCVRSCNLLAETNNSLSAEVFLRLLIFDVQKTSSLQLETRSYPNCSYCYLLVFPGTERCNNPLQRRYLLVIHISFSVSFDTKEPNKLQRVEIITANIYTQSGGRGVRSFDGNYFFDRKGTVF